MRVCGVVRVPFGETLSQVGVLDGERVKVEVDVELTVSVWQGAVPPATALKASEEALKVSGPVVLVLPVTTTAMGSCQVLLAVFETVNAM